jgi:hypothetical protein
MLLSAELSALEPTTPFHEPNAILINISEADLNRIARDAFREHYTTISGATSNPSRGIQDLRYEATFSEPILELDDDGGIRVDLDLLEAELRIGRFEHKFMRKMASCDGLGLNVNPDRPVEVALHMRFEVEDHDLHIVPLSVTVENTKGFRLVKPTICRNTWLPKWLVWWIGKGQLRRKIGELDEMLLAKARSGAAELSEGSGFLTKHWSIEARDDSAPASDFYLYPQKVDTSHGSLLVGFTGSATQLQTASHSMPDWVAAESQRSYLGLSESFLNAAIRTAIGRLRTQPHKPSGGLSKLLHGSGGHSLIPGLRDLESTENLRLGLAFQHPPAIEFEALDHAVSERALIRIRLSGVELTIWDSDELLGTLEIESARLAVAPYLNLLGGISFDVVENEWLLSSRGIDFDEETLAAMFQELFFGEMFETSYQPLAQRSFKLGETKFHPRYFSLLGRYLVIGLSEFGPSAAAGPNSQTNR